MRLTAPSLAVALALISGSIASGCATTAPGPRLDSSNREAWREHLAPRASELTWESLPWLTSYADGVVAAQEQRRPLLLWVMNGHPLGCT